MSSKKARCRKKYLMVKHRTYNNVVLLVAARAIGLCRLTSISPARRCRIYLSLMHIAWLGEEVMMKLQRGADEGLRRQLGEGNHVV